MAPSSPLGLTQPREHSRGGVIALVAVTTAFVAFVVIIYLWGKTPLAPLPVLSTVHAVANAASIA